MDFSNSLPALFVTAAIAAIVMVFVIIFNKGKETQSASCISSDKPSSVEDTAKSPQPKKTRLNVRKDTKFTFKHPWLASSLKMHGANILDVDFSPNNKYLVSCAEDRSLILWSTREFEKKEHKPVRGNVDLDHATRIQFSPDAKAVVTSLCNENALRVIKLVKKEEGSVLFQTAVEFPKATHIDIKNIGISSTGKFIMAYHADTALRIYNLKGELLTTVDTKQSINNKGAVSPCGRFVASAGFTPDVKVWEVLFDKSNSFQDVRRAFELKGHSAGVYDFSFSAGSTHMATVSKDGTWKFWHTEVDYKQDQDPKLLQTGSVESEGPCLIALSPDAFAVAVATGTTVTMYDTATASAQQVFHSCTPDAITAIKFDQGSRYLVVAGGKHINVVYNVVGFKASITLLSEKRKKTDSKAFKERLTEQIEELRNQLKQLGEDHRDG